MADKVKIKLLASLRDLAGGVHEVVIEAGDWRRALLILKEKYNGLSIAIDDRGNPRPGYLVFVDGIDSRLLEESKGYKPKEIVLLPVNHGGTHGQEPLVIGWREIEDAIDKIAGGITNSNYNIDVIIGILRGGIVPARLLADALDVSDIYFIEVKLYTGVGVRHARPYIKQLALPELYGKNVLIVDDVSDSGLSLQLALQLINMYMPRQVKTATLYVKPWTKQIPDYYADITDKWIVFPWEKYEFKRLITYKEASLEHA
ncbi:MAG: hypothetical protein F7C81_05540 [Desulfurococcales archaeon]|nr:hypothetical protein [Desulfurococcales archaeon]